MTVHICPVCEGRQTVPAGFYRDVKKREGPQTCRACGGAGVFHGLGLYPLAPAQPYMPPAVPPPNIPASQPWPGYPQPYIGDWPLAASDRFWWGVVPPDGFTTGGTLPATTITACGPESYLGASSTIRVSS